MRKQSTIAVLLLASIASMMVANPGMPAKKKGRKAQADSTALAVDDSIVVDSLEDDAASDTTKMDSLQKAIWKHNKVVMTVSGSIVSIERSRAASMHLLTIRPTTRWCMMPTTRWRISMATRT